MIDLSGNSSITKIDSDINKLEKILQKFNKIEQFKAIIKNIDDSLSDINQLKNFLQAGKIKLKVSKDYKSNPYTYESSDKNTLILRQSIEKIQFKLNKPNLKVEWKTCREILNLSKDPIILPDKIDGSNFNPGKIKDSYFISYIQLLSQIPHLLNYIMALSDKKWSNVNRFVFIVNFFIDGEWKRIYIDDLFPCYKDENNKYHLLGVRPKENELFMMILEKAWAQVNGGYDIIEKGFLINDFEFFLGGSFQIIIKENFCNNILNYIDFDTFGISWAFGHAFAIKSLFEVPRKNAINKYDKLKIFIISCPHAVEPNGIDIEKINKIFEEECFYYKDFVDKNNLYKNTANTGDNNIIYIPLEYFIALKCYWGFFFPHYGYKSYIYKLDDNLEYLYTYKIELNEKQLFTCQICFQNYRVHRDKIDKINVELNEQKNEIYLYYNFCGILFAKYEGGKLIIINKYINDLKSKEANLKSVEELNALLDKGEYYIMVYSESSINNSIIRFLSEKDIKIEALKKYDINGKNEKEYTNYIYNIKSIINVYKDNNIEEKIKNIFSTESFLNDFFNEPKDKNYIYIKKEEDFLPGIKDYYIHLKEIAKMRILNPEDALYSITKEGEEILYEIIDKYTFNIIYKERVGEDGFPKFDLINFGILQFRDCLGYPYKVNCFNDAIKQMKKNNEPLNCLLSQYDEYDYKNRNLKNETIDLEVYYNSKMKEDILVINDKKGNKKMLNNTPLLIIIMDTSWSMHSYLNYLVNEVIPKTLQKLNYCQNEESLYDKLIKLKITKLELLHAMSSKIKYAHFARKNNFNYNLDKQRLQKYCDNLIPLITFDDQAKLYFYDINDFKKGNIESGGSTQFIGAASYLETLLKFINSERSIRLLTFSDGEIFDSTKSINYLEKILNSKEGKRQMYSLPVRVYHDSEPDSEVLLKLSNFSYPISDMSQITIQPQKMTSDEVADLIYERFASDGMQYNLILVSDLIETSNEFSKKFSKEQYFNDKQEVLRVNGHFPLTNYENSLKVVNCPLKVDYCGELNKNSFYEIMKNSTPYISQRFLSRKIDKTNSSENKEIIEYFKKTETNFENLENQKNFTLNFKPKIYEIFEEIESNQEFDNFSPNELSNYIETVKNKTIKIIEDNRNESKSFFEGLTNCKFPCSGK